MKENYEDWFDEFATRQAQKIDSKFESVSSEESECEILAEICKEYDFELWNQ